MHIGLNRTYTGEEVYRLILIDATSGKSWLNPLIDNEKPICKQNNLCALLKFCIFELNIQDRDNSTASKLLTWLNTPLRVD